MTIHDVVVKLTGNLEKSSYGVSGIYAVVSNGVNFLSTRLDLGTRRFPYIPLGKIF